jgi:hypothetical protein
VLYERQALQESVLAKGTQEMAAREDEARMLRLHCAELERSIGVAQGVAPQAGRLAPGNCPAPGACSAAATWSQRSHCLAACAALGALLCAPWACSCSPPLCLPCHLQERATDEKIAHALQELLEARREAAELEAQLEEPGNLDRWGRQLAWARVLLVNGHGHGAAGLKGICSSL